MKTLKEELNDFILTISKEEMKHNHKLRNKIKLLKERMERTFSNIEKKAICSFKSSG